MNPYALPNIIAFVLLLVFGVAVIFQNARDKSNRLLFALCLNLALSVGAGGLLHLSTSEAQANFWNKWPYILGLPSTIFAFEYALQISGRIHRLKETLLGVPIAVHRWIIYGNVPIWLLILIFTDLILAPAKFYTPTGWEHGYGSPFPGEENNDMFFTIWYGVFKKSTRELTYASGGHPPALLIGDNAAKDSGATQLRTANNVLGAMPDVTYIKNQYLVGERTTLYIFSDGVYEVEKSDGSMWQFAEFSDFMANIKSDSQSRLDRLYRHAENISIQDSFEDDFTILEVAFG